jgi:hypothetical protein
MSDRRNFLRTVVVAPLAIKYASISNLFGIETYIRPEEAKLVFERVVAQSGLAKYWDYLRVTPAHHVAERLCYGDGREDDFLIPGQYVTQLLGVRKKDGTNFYGNIAFPEGKPVTREILETKCRFAISRFEGWSECDCVVGFNCERHGGPRKWQVVEEHEVGEIIETKI